MIYFCISIRYVLAVSSVPQTAQRRRMTDDKLERLWEETAIAYHGDRLWGLKKIFRNSIRFDNVSAWGWKAPQLSHYINLLCYSV